MEEATGTMSAIGSPSQRQESMDVDQPMENGHDSSVMDVEKSASSSSSLGQGTSLEVNTKASLAAVSTLDCYPYTFTPLLLFAQENYFHKGYSNYNSVAQFFSSVMPVDMLDKVLYERRNMLYEELLDWISQNEVLVTCCIDSHFTALKVIHKNAAIYYDPMSPRIKLVTGDSFRTLALYLLLKCNYGDSEHVRDNKDYYVNGNAIRKSIYIIWKKINRITSINTLTPMKMTTVALDTDRYFFINAEGNTLAMTTQKTGNTCYFQVYLFAVLCKVGNLILSPSKENLIISNEDLLETTVIGMLEFLTTFFYDGKVMRPLTNSNVLIDFFRFRSSPYYSAIVWYLERAHRRNPNYESQFYELIAYFERTTPLQTFERFSSDGAMPSTPNTKSLQLVRDSSGALSKLASANYYKYRAANLMFGCNSNILREIGSFSEWNAWRKNQLLNYYEEAHMSGCVDAVQKLVKFRDYYFMPQFEVGQDALVNLHHYTYLVDVAEFVNLDPALVARLHKANHVLVNKTLFSTSRQNNYEKIMPLEDFKRTKSFKFFLDSFLTASFFKEFTALGFAEINPAEKDINSLSQTVFYSTDLMMTQGNRQSMEFEKECINQMSRSTLRKAIMRFDEPLNPSQKYNVRNYWRNPDLTNISVFGKDVRTLLAISSQKLFFDGDHNGGSYYYGPFEKIHDYGGCMDLAVASSVGHAVPTISIDKRKKGNNLLLTDRVFEFHYLRRILVNLFASANGVQIKTDNEVVNLCLLSLMLDFGLYEEYCDLLRLPFLQRLQHKADTRELQVEIANTIYEFDRKNTTDYVTRSRVEELLFEFGYKFLVSKDFSVQSAQFKLIRALNTDPDYQGYVIMCKVYLSLCQINKSIELDYYKVYCDGAFRIVIPQNFSKSTCDYLDSVTKRYTFSERHGFLLHDDLPVFDLKPQQPEINLHRVRFDSASGIQSCVKYLDISNAFQVVGTSDSYLVFVADNVLQIETRQDGSTKSQINKADVCVATVYLGSISFIPCFKYADTSDVVLFTSPNFHYMVDNSGQFANDYYGMKNDLIENIKSDELLVSENDEHIVKVFSLQNLVGESKTVVYHPYYLLQVHDRQHLINLLDLAIKLRNVPFFVLTLIFLRRCSVKLEYVFKENGVQLITGPWRTAITYAEDATNMDANYAAILKRQFFDLNSHKGLPMVEFIELICENFTRFQRHIDGVAEIIPRARQKEFLQKLIKGPEPFHFSEVGSGKTKVILPLFCQLFLSNNEEIHKYLSKDGMAKRVLIAIFPAHLLADAKSQVLRYCLSMNFEEEYRIYDDIFALMHPNVQIRSSSKIIFVTSFNLLKKALTYDAICTKVRPHRQRILLLVDEVDDFLDRDKLVFNICSNQNNSFDRETLDRFFSVSRAAYNKSGCPSVSSASNPGYWTTLYDKFCAIHVEIQDASRSINKSFGIFNEMTLRHCASSIAQDIEGYKSLIARPYESVNRAMPGSYYSDVERTIFLTFVILTEDSEKYNDLFQAERKNITFEFWKEHFLHQLDYDDLVYGHERFSEVVSKHPGAIDGLQKYLYGIILRRMEIRDKSRSVNSVDVIFNFDAVGFTGTPFLDNYPTFDYIRHQRQDEIPCLIERSFYAYTCEGLSQDVFEDRFRQFQGSNDQVNARYVCSDFIQSSMPEMEILRALFNREAATDGNVFNVIVDLAGIFKVSTVQDIKHLLLNHFGLSQFHYLYHIDQADNSDRVMCIETENDMCFDEEFFKYAVKRYGKDLMKRVFFFVDNRNVIGKDIPFQLSFHRDFGVPMFGKSLVLAHDVGDFSKIWQAMGRSRTMNSTEFCIYRSGISGLDGADASIADIKNNQLTRHMYVTNCDRRIAGNISSIYLTIIAVFNLSNDSFYYCDTIVNTFLEKMNNCLVRKVGKHVDEVLAVVTKRPIAAQIMLHILSDKFRKSSNKTIANRRLTEPVVQRVLQNIIEKKYEIRRPTTDIYDDFMTYLSGEQENQMEISYTKQQQKQKQTQQNKNHDSDAMSLFDKANQLTLGFVVTEYYEQTRRPENDKAKILLNLPAFDPIVSFSYASDNGSCRSVSVYPTLQFLYSHFIEGSFISDSVKQTYQSFDDNASRFASRFFASARARRQETEANGALGGDALEVKVHCNFVRQNPKYSMAALERGIYVIGTKDQFNLWDIATSPVCKNAQYVIDEVGFVLYDSTESTTLDDVSPYFIENYLLMELLAKQEVAQNVIDYYCKSKADLQQAVESYDSTQGKGFVCWRFLMNARIRQAQLAAKVKDDAMDVDMLPPCSGNKRALL